MAKQSWEGEQAPALFQGFGADTVAKYSPGMGEQSPKPLLSQGSGVMSTGIFHLPDGESPAAFGVHEPIADPCILLCWECSAGSVSAPACLSPSTLTPQVDKGGANEPNLRVKLDRVSMSVIRGAGNAK